MNLFCTVIGNYSTCCDVIFTQRKYRGSRKWACNDNNNNNKDNNRIFNCCSLIMQYPSNRNRSLSLLVFLTTCFFSVLDSFATKLHKCITRTVSNRITETYSVLLRSKCATTISKSIYFYNQYFWNEPKKTVDERSEAIGIKGISIFRNFIFELLLCIHIMTIGRENSTTDTVSATVRFLACVSGEKACIHAREPWNYAVKSIDFSDNRTDVNYNFKIVVKMYELSRHQRQYESTGVRKEQRTKYLHSKFTKFI